MEESVLNIHGVPWQLSHGGKIQDYKKNKNGTYSYINAHILARNRGCLLLGKTAIRHFRIFRMGF